MFFKVFNVIILNLLFLTKSSAETKEDACMYLDPGFVQKCCEQIVNKTSISKHIISTSKCQIEIIQSTDPHKPELLSCDEHICANRCAGLANNEV